MMKVERLYFKMIQALCLRKISDHLDFEQVELKVACLFLSMQTVLHVTSSAIQKIVEEICDILIC